MSIELLTGIIIPRFHQNGTRSKDIDHLLRFKIYKLSCFIFAINGILKMKTEKYFGLLLFLQSFLSYMSDVYTLGYHSKWHVIDRYFAFFMTLYRFYLVKNVRTHIFNIPLIYLAHEYLRKSQLLYDSNNINFLTEHTKWHIVASLIIFLN